MAGYFGTEFQTRLQKRSDERAEWARKTPGAYNSGRMLASEDPDRLGWDSILEFLERDGAFGFRMLPADRAADLVGRLTPRGYRVDFWDTFIAGRSAAMSRVEEILANGLPGDLMQLDMAIEATSPIVRHVQEFMARNGIAPFSGSMLVGEIEPALTVVVAEPDGTIVATAHAYRPHNIYSPYHTAAWGGLIAVAESQRGRKLGTYVNAMMIRAAFEQLAVDRIYELASATNIPSRRMIEACGLSMEPNLKAATAGPQGEKFTR